MQSRKPTTLFAKATTKSKNKNFWKVLIVDDEQDVHVVTQAVLSDFSFQDKNIKFFNAYSAKEAIDIMRKEDDIALVLLDVVMEDDDSGLKVVKAIREELKNNFVRIILRTGQPGSAPEEKVIIDYDINDYKEKTELTSKKLFTTVVTALRGFHDLQSLHEKEKLVILQSRQALMGEMLSMIAHQWRQPISVIAMGANNLLINIELDDLEPENIKETANRILLQTVHLSKTIDDFKNFFSPNKKKELIDVNVILENTFEIIEKSLENNNIAVKKEYTSKSQITLYSRELMQVFLNIVKNAKDALIESDIKDPSIYIETKEDDMNVYISICDNANGISDDVMPNIFDPYFTTKGVKSGTGLGLYITKTIIEKHLYGTIEAKNKEEGGTCFIITIPLKVRDSN